MLVGNSEKQILLTVDVEDWFQVENLRGLMPCSSWDEKELRIESSTHRILDLFDLIPCSGMGSEDPAQATKGSAAWPTRPFVKATFFILAWVAERVPSLVREIYCRGHEVASHGYSHTLYTNHSGRELREDLLRSKKILEDILGMPVHGYRAPNFSVSKELLSVVEECGYEYDSSYNSLHYNPRYGRLNLNGYPKAGIAYDLSGGLIEVPISNLRLGKSVLPVGGGAYFRLMPVRVFSLLAHQILKREDAFVFYLHPWETDFDQPRVQCVSALGALRHYFGLRRTVSKLTALLNDFSTFRFISCMDYVGEVKRRLAVD